MRQIFELNGLLGRKHARGQDFKDYRQSDILVDPYLSENKETSFAIRSEQGPPQNSMVSMGDAALSVETATLPVPKLSQTPKVLAAARSGFRDITNSAASKNRLPLPKAESPSKRAVTKAAGTPAHPGPLKTPARFAETSSQIKARGVGDRFASRPTSSCPACLAGEWEL